MKSAGSVILITFVLLTFVGAARAAEMFGEVVAVDSTKDTLTLKNGAVTAVFDGEAGSVIKELKTGDKVTVQYKEVGGKKVATKVAPLKKQVSVGC